MYVVELVKLETIIVYFILKNNLSHSLQILSNYFFNFSRNWKYLLAHKWLQKSRICRGQSAFDWQMRRWSATGILYTISGLPWHWQHVVGETNVLHSDLFCWKIRIELYFAHCLTQAMIENAIISFDLKLDRLPLIARFMAPCWPVELIPGIKIISQRIRLCHIVNSLWPVSLRHQDSNQQAYRSKSFGI